MTTEIIFWCIAALMLAAAAAFVAAAFFRTQRFCASGESSAETSRSLLNEELEHLRGERDAGLISEAIYVDSVEDVRRRAIEDLAHGAQTRHEIGHKRLAAVVVSALVAASALGIYLKVGAPGMIPFVDSQRTQGLMRADGSLQAMAPQYDAPLMERYLERNSDDERAWVLLARLYVQDREWPKAAAAYRSAIDLKGKVSRDPEVWVEYAGSLMSINEPGAYEKGLAPLEEALRLDEGSISAHELYVLACLETQRWQKALEHLEYLLTRIHMDNPKYPRLAQLAAFAADMVRAHDKAPEAEGSRSAGAP